MKKLILIFSAIISASFLFSQEALKSTEEEYYDFLSLTGVVERPTLGYRTLSDSEWNFTEENAEHPWQNNNLGTKRTIREGSEGTNWFTRGFEHNVKVKVYGPEWYNSYNTAAPYGQNDGALWQGKGYNSSLTGGARLEAYGFEVTVKPQLNFSENKDFDYFIDINNSNFYYTDKDTGNRLPISKYTDKALNYGYFHGNIDLPQRYGDNSFWNFDWGDSEIRWTWHTLTFGAGFQSPWLGPAWLNPMLGSNNAPTYPKLDAGLRRTKVYLPFCDWYIGDIEGRIWLGKLSESEYYDNNPDNNSRLLTAMSASYKPSFIPGFTFGLNRIFITNWSKHNLKYIARLFTLSQSNGSQTGTGEDEDQKVSLFIDWQFPKIGFEFYGELGIDDFTSQKLANPFHTAIYTIGVKQYIPLPFSKISEKFSDLKSELIFEWNNFEMSQDFQMQWQYMGYYAHGSIQQGYTQKGQILGAGTGYFGNSQFLGYKIYFPKGYVMPFFHRHCPDNNYIYNMTVGKAINNKSPEFEHYYGIFKTYRSIGAELNYFITQNLNITGNLAIMFINFPKYDKNEIGNINCHGTLTIKYNF